MKTFLCKHYRALALALTVTCGLNVSADEIFNTDFSKGKVDELGWAQKGNWELVNYGADRPNLEKNPGPVMKFSAHSSTAGTLTRKFDALANPASLTLTFDGGYGWGAPNHSQGLSVMILDDEGNGYIFITQRAKANWAAQWDVVNKYAFNEQKHWAPASIDTTQRSVVDGGGLRTFTISRDGSGKWTFNGDGWTGGPLAFTDTTHANFSQVILVGTPNNDDLLFNRVKLEATK